MCARQARHVAPIERRAIRFRCRSTLYPTPPRGENRRLRPAAASLTAGRGSREFGRSEGSSRGNPRVGRRQNRDRSLGSWLTGRCSPRVHMASVGGSDGSVRAGSRNTRLSAARLISPDGSAGLIDAAPALRTQREKSHRLTDRYRSAGVAVDAALGLVSAVCVHRAGKPIRI